MSATTLKNIIRILTGIVVPAFPLPDMAASEPLFPAKSRRFTQVAPLRSSEEKLRTDGGRFLEQALYGRVISEEEVEAIILTPSAEPLGLC